MLKSYAAENLCQEVSLKSYATEKFAMFALQACRGGRHEEIPLQERVGIVG